jgi:putative sigma-54 modulation protein
MLVEITISCRHTELSEAVEEATREKISRLERYLDGMHRAEVVFDEEHNPRIADKERCEVAIDGKGHHLLAKAAAPDPFTAVERVARKLEHQLRKEKTKNVDRPHVEGRRQSRSQRVEAAGRLADDELSA